MAMQAGVKVVSASYSSTSFNQADLDAIESLGQAGVVFVAAAGNGEALTSGRSGINSLEVPSA